MCIAFVMFKLSVQHKCEHFLKKIYRNVHLNINFTTIQKEKKKKKPIPKGSRE